MRITDIKNRELRELAELRTTEAGLYSDELLNAFDWSVTKEGDAFWGDVYSKLRTDSKPELDELVIANERIDVLTKIIENDKDLLDRKDEKIAILDEVIEELKVHIITQEVLRDIR